MATTPGSGVERASLPARLAVAAGRLNDEIESLIALRNEMHGDPNKLSEPSPGEVPGKRMPLDEALAFAEGSMQSAAAEIASFRLHIQEFLL